MRFFFFIFSLHFFVCFFPLYASNLSQADDKEELVHSSYLSIIPKGLDFKTRDAKRRLLEFEPFGGEYLGNELNNSFVTGGRFAFQVTDALAIGSEFNYSRIYFDRQGEFGSSVKTKNEFISDVFFTYSFPILQRAGGGVQEADLFTSGGLGALRINKKNRFVGMLGGGLKIFTSVPWLAIRFDVNTYLYSFPLSTHSKFTDDWTFTVGPSFLLFPKKSSQ